MMNTALSKEDIAAIKRHHAHACEKHPHFADSLLPRWVTKQAIRGWITDCRETLRECAKRKHYDALAVLECEEAEAAEATFFGHWDDAIEEHYDAIAVHLRCIEKLKEKKRAAKEKSKEKAKDGRK